MFDKYLYFFGFFRFLGLVALFKYYSKITEKQLSELKKAFCDSLAIQMEESE